MEGRDEHSEGDQNLNVLLLLLLRLRWFSSIFLIRLAAFSDIGYHRIGRLYPIFPIIKVKANCKKQLTLVVLI